MTASSASFSPRLASSRQWTDLPKDFLEKVLVVFKDQFSPEASRGEFFVDGRIYPEEIVMRLGYLENGRLRQMNFEASVDLPQRRPEQEEVEGKTMERVYTCVDALGAVMEDYFDADPEEGDEIEIPLSWKAYEFEGETVYLQHSTINTRLEEEADRLLGLVDDALVREESSTEDALAKAEIDNVLAFDVQKVIRTGKYPRVVDPDNEDELN